MKNDNSEGFSFLAFSRATGLTSVNQVTTAYLLDEEGVSMTDMAELVGTSTAAMTGIADKLEEIGLAVRKSPKRGDGRDRRTVILHPTKALLKAQAEQRKPGMEGGAE